MVIKVAVPHQFKLKVIPDLKTLFFCGQKRHSLHRRIGYSACTFRGGGRKESNQRPWDRKRRKCKENTD